MHGITTHALYILCAIHIVMQVLAYVVLQSFIAHRHAMNECACAIVLTLTTPHSACVKGYKRLCGI